MRKRLLPSLLAACMALTLFQGPALAADNLNSEEGSGHEHSWSEAWGSNETHHWHDCTVEGCTEKGQNDTHLWVYGSSSDTEAPKDVVYTSQRDTQCLPCGSVRKGAESSEGGHNHVWSEDQWAYNSEYHGLKCTVAGCDVVTNAVKHTITDGVCTVCGYKQDSSEPGTDPDPGPGTDPEPEPHKHVWSEAWTSDEDHHWHSCTVAGCDVTVNSEKDGYGPHDWVYETAGDTESPKLCSICARKEGQTGEVKPEHEHSWSMEWSKDAAEHWHECLNEGCPITENAQKYGAGAHEFDTSSTTVDATCKTCGYVRKGSGSSGSGSSGGGGGGGSSSGTTVTVPVSGGSGTVQVSASVSGTTATVSEIDVSKLAGTSQVKMDFSGLGKNIETVQLPASALKAITSVDGVDSLSIKLSAGEVAFDASALESIQSQAGSQISLTVAPAKSSALNARQKEVVGSAPVFDLRLQSGSKAITSFGDGYATVSLPYTLPADQDPSSVVVYYLDGSGNIQPCQTMYDVRSKTVIFTTGHFSLYFVGQAESDGWKNPFVDVRESDWFYEAVKYANMNGLLDGLGGGRFAPNANLSRAQLAQILYAKEGRPASGGANSFTDVDAGKWYTPAVVWAAEQGIVSGFGDGRFGPDNNITREQLALMLWRYAGSPAVSGGELRFTDADQVSDWALEAVRWAVGDGIVSGHDDGRLAPQGLATRAQAAQMLKNFLEK